MSVILEPTRTGAPANASTAERRAWVESRHAACVAELMARGVDFAIAWDVAVAIVAHWVRECGWGRKEWNFNVGNMRKGRTWDGDVHLLQGGDDPAPAPYRAYGSLAEGVRNHVGLLTVDTYDQVLAALVRSVRDGVVSTVEYGGAFEVLGDPVNWYANLMRAGWHPYSDASLHDYRGVLKTVSAWVGRPDPTGAAVFAAGVGAALLALAMVLSARTNATRIEV